MVCKRCPHLVRHGQAAQDGKSIEFKNICGLTMKQKQTKECTNYPFPSFFDYIECETYQATFKSSSRKNDVVPTKDFQYSDALTTSSITDMELL